MFSQEQQDNVHTSSPSLAGAIFYAVFGLPFTAGGLYMTAVAFTGMFGLFIGGILFLGAGISLEWRAYKAFRRWQAYGTTHLRLESTPVPLGGSLRARLQVPIDKQPPNGFQVRVASIQGSGDDKDTVWEDWTSVSGQPGPGETEVPLSLDLPAQPLPDHLRQMAEDKPWCSLQDTLEKLDWEMEVTASFEDKPDYEASFDLPVSVPANVKERAADDASTNGSISSPASDDEETAPSDAPDEDEVYWGVDEEGEEADLRRTDSETAGSDDSESSFTEPVSAGIHMEGRPGKGLTFSFDHARPSIRSFGYKVAVPGMVFTGIGVPTLFMALSNGQTGLLLFAVLSILGGGVALRKAWTTLTHAASLQVANGTIKLKKGPYFLNSAPTRYHPANLDEVKVKATGGSGDQSFYTLMLMRRGSDTPILVAGGLADKAEAEWIADQVRQAIDQQTASA